MSPPTVPPDPPPSPAEVSTPGPWRRRLERLGAGVLLLCVLALLCGRPLARAFPGLLIERSPPRAADALIVLAGDHRGQRVDAAVSLWKANYVATGPFVVSGGQAYGEVSWAGLMQARAEAQGVAPTRIQRQDRSRTTAEDAAFCAEILALPPGSTVILVTSPWHSGRAAEHFRDAFGPDVHVVSCPSPAREGDWWGSAEDARALATEVLKRLWPGEGG